MTRRKEIFRYIVFGILTTLVALVVFQGLEWMLPGERSYLFSNAAQFVVALAFAFVVNKLFVFEQKSWAFRLVLREIWTFTSTRLISFGLEYVLTIIFFEWVWPLVAPRFTQRWLNFTPAQWLPEGFYAEDAYRFVVRWGVIAVVVVVLNYVFAKWIVFRKKEQVSDENAQ
ncbi:MAG: GtrA family protein [Oscillospiraceae bacterium]|nr:GtrA family protein [Oscillospiraceae bacterium]